MLGIKVEPGNIPDNKNIKLLLVDDDPLILRIAEAILKPRNFNCVTASDGKQAVDKLQAGSFNIVITDINMPNMNGMELLKHIVKHYPQTGVIVITGLSEDFSYVDVISAGAIDYITKPFDRDELLAKLKRVIREQALVKQLEQISISDSLTKLYNRRYFDIKIIEEIRRAGRQNYRIFLAFIDIDNFKSFNDSNGHQAGDYVLQALGDIMSNCARRGVDWPFRYGGDEFAIIITQTTPEQALLVNERIAECYTKHNFGKTSLSFGLSEFHRNEHVDWQTDVDGFVKKTDNAMYQAKASGKNQIFIVD